MAFEVRSDRDVVTAALRRLNIIPGDAEAEGFELDNTLAAWHALVAELALDELAEFAPDQVPLDAFRHCAELLADVVAPANGHKPFADPNDLQHPSRLFLMRRLSNRRGGDVMEINPF